MRWKIEYMFCNVVYVYLCMYVYMYMYISKTLTHNNYNLDKNNNVLSARLIAPGLCACSQENTMKH